MRLTAGGGRLSKLERRTLAVLLVVAFALRLGLWAFFPNTHHPDELFQYLEQGHRLSFDFGVVPWEFREGTRSWLLPGFIGGLMRVTALLGGGPSAYLFVVAAALSLISVSIVAVAFHWARQVAGSKTAVIAAVIAATWLELVYFGAKSLTGAVAMSTLFAGAYLLLSSTGSRRRLIVAGVLLGLTFVLRMHLFPAILALLIAGFCKSSWKSFLAVAAGCLGIVTLAGVLDWLTWDYPFQSFVEAFRVNIIEGKAATYGTDPFYAYALKYEHAWSFFWIPLAALALAGARRAPLVLLVPLAILLSHSAIAHKEARFVLPALPFILLLASIGTTDAIDLIRSWWPRVHHTMLTAAALGCWIAASAVLTQTLQFRRLIRKNADRLAAFHEVRTLDSACGLALLDVDWFSSGGYTYLHREIPIFAVSNEAELVEIRAEANVVLARQPGPVAEPGYRQWRCFESDLCLYVREGTCEPGTDKHYRLSM